MDKIITRAYKVGYRVMFLVLFVDLYLEMVRLPRTIFGLQDSYMQHDLPESLTAEHRELVKDLFDWLVEPCLEFIRYYKYYYN